MQSTRPICHIELVIFLLLSIPGLRGGPVCSCCTWTLFGLEGCNFNSKLSCMASLYAFVGIESSMAFLSDPNVRSGRRFFVKLISSIACVNPMAPTCSLMAVTDAGCLPL